MKKFSVVFLIAGISVLFACSQPPLLFGAASATPSSSPNSLVEKLKIEPWTIEPETNDGKISLMISGVNEECHSLGQPIQIRLALHNLTNDTLSIPGIFAISTNRVGAVDITAAMKPANKAEIYAAIEPDREINPLSRIPTPSAYYELHTNDTFEKILDYRTRPQIGLYDSLKDKYYDLSVRPGRYSLMFLYMLSNFDFLGRQQDRIGYAISNQIEICLK